jgi:hypothetical protein
MTFQYTQGKMNLYRTVHHQIQEGGTTIPQQQFYGSTSV